MFDIKKLPGNVVELGIVDTDNGGNGIPEDISIVISARFFNKLSNTIIFFGFLCVLLCVGTKVIFRTFANRGCMDFFLFHETLGRILKTKFWKN